MKGFCLLVFWGYALVEVVGRRGEGNPLYRLGILLPEYRIVKNAGAVQLAIEKITEEKTLGNSTIDWIWINTNNSAVDGISGAIKARNKYGQSLDGLVGGTMDTVCIPVALYASAVKMPFVSTECGTFMYDPKSADTYADLVSHTDNDMIELFVKFLHHFNWKKIAVITGSSEEEYSYGSDVKTGFEKRNVTVFLKSIELRGKPHRHSADSDDMVYSLYFSARIFVLILSLREECEFFVQAYDLDYTNGSCVLIGRIDHPDDCKGIFNASHREAFKGYIKFSGHMEIKNTNDFLRKAGARYGKDVKEKVGLDTTLHPGDQAEKWSIYLYYGIQLWANILKRSIDTGLYDPTTRRFNRFRKHLVNLSFPGLTPESAIKFDKNSEAISNFTVEMWDGKEFRTLFTLKVQEKKLFDHHETPTWMNGVKKVPEDVPACGFKNDLCADNDISECYCNEQATVNLLVVILILTMNMVIPLVSVLHFRKQKLISLISSGDTWLIKFEDLKALPMKHENYKMRAKAVKDEEQSKDHVSGHSGHSERRKSASYTVSSASLVSREFRNKSKSDSCMIFMEKTNSKNGCSLFQGSEVYIKMLNKNTVPWQEPEYFDEIKMVRTMEHENIAKFIGACPEHPTVCIVMEFCSRRSLEDVLEESHIKLTRDIKTALLLDISKGMTYLHNSPLQSHGNLKSRNCVIDGKWVCKITDYGLGLFRTSGVFSLADRTRILQDQLFIAPEILRTKSAPMYGTQKGDVYSFAMIMQYLWTEKRPFYFNENTTVTEMLFKVTECACGLFHRPQEPPAVFNVEIPKEFILLSRDCWAENPLVRPSFSRIVERIRQIHGSKKEAVVELVAKAMEEQIEALEDLFYERELGVIEEKKKMEELLNRLLPKSLALQMKVNEYPPPTSYKCVTMFFTDIVGFTTLCDASTHQEVITFLNELYTMFDEILDQYDAYKIETIGDAYVVVSGAPDTNGDRHAVEIANMSLQMLCGLKNFTIKHKPGEVLKLRIGLHSGPVVAAVLGLQAPRFRVFGKTQRIGEEMESSGTPLRIQMSDSTVKLLDLFGGYRYIERGPHMTKVGEKVTTYWLYGIENQCLLIPNPPVDINSSDVEGDRVYFNAVKDATTFEDEV